jgi:hypothetical protein
VNDALERFAHEFPAGTVLFEEGQRGHVMYIVVSGEIEIRRRIGGAERVLAALGDGEFFGEMAILSGRPRSATAVVRRAARLLVIDGTTFEAMLRARPEIALRLIKALAARLEATNQHVELLLLPTADHRVVQCLRHMAEEQLQLAAAQPVAPHLTAPRTSPPGSGSRSRRSPASSTACARRAWCSWPRTQESPGTASSSPRSAGCSSSSSWSASRRDPPPGR